MVVNRQTAARPELGTTEAVDVETGVSLVERLVGEKVCEQSVVLVCVVGGSATGKTHYITPKITERFERVEALAEDNYCLGNSGSTRIHGKPNLHRFVDYEPARIYSDLTMLKSGFGIEAPLYAYDKRERREEVVKIQPAPVIIMEGCFLLQPVISNVFDVKVFIETDDHSRFARRMLRPRRNPAQSDTHRLREYIELSYPGYITEVAPYAKNADVVIENPYVPDVSSVAETGLGLGEENVAEAEKVVEVCEYTHPRMTPDELLSMSVTEKGLQVVTYLPNRWMPGIGVRFRVHTDEFVVNLEDVGYAVAN